VRDGLRLGSHVEAMDRAWKIRRQVPTTVRGADLQVGKPLEHAAEDKVTQGNSGVQRIADHVRQVVPGDALAERRSRGMNKDQRAESLSRGPEGLESLIVEVHPVDVGADLH